MKANSRLRLILAITLLGLVVGCGGQANQINPQNSGVWLVSTEQEVEIGKEVAQSVEQEYEALHDPQLDAYVNNLGNELARVSDRPNLEYRFTVLDTPIINAFAAPGGFIYVTTGLIGAMDDEAMFAGVVGHEIGHVAARHGAKKMQAAILTQVAFTALYVAFKDDVDENYFVAANAAANLIFLGYSRGDEHQADILGVKYEYNAGYDPYGMRDVLVVFDRMQARDPIFIEQWLSSHPEPGERIQHVEEWIDKLYLNEGNMGPKPSELARNKTKYQQIARRYGTFEGENEILALITNLRVGIDTHNKGLIENTLAADYLDDQGYNKEGFMASLSELYQSYPEVRYRLVSDPTVEITSPFEATAYYRCELTLGSSSGRKEVLMGDVRLSLRQQEGRWQIAQSSPLFPFEQDAQNWRNKG